MKTPPQFDMDNPLDRRAVTASIQETFLQGIQMVLRDVHRGTGEIPVSVLLITVDNRLCAGCGESHPLVTLIGPPNSPHGNDPTQFLRNISEALNNQTDPEQRH